MMAILSQRGIEGLEALGAMAKEEKILIMTCVPISTQSIKKDFH